MTNAQLPAHAAARRAWVIGGVLLLATVVSAVAIPANSLGTGFVGKALYSASLLVFAFGIRGSGSITARRPLGTAALTVLAILALLVPVLESVFFSGNYLPGPLLAFSYVASFVQFVAALIAVTQIARAGIVPRPWNWAPTWILAAVAVSWLPQHIPAAGATQDALAILFVVANFDGLVHVGSSVFLGVLAIVLANRPNPSRTVPVYPPSV